MAQALERPVCTATIAEDDSVEVTIDRVPYAFSSMATAIEHMVSVADELGRPVKMTAIDPASEIEPQTRLIVSADGSVAADASSSATKRASRRGSSRVVTVDDLTPDAEQAPTPANEPEPIPEVSGNGSGHSPAVEAPAAAPRSAATSSGEEPSEVLETGPEAVSASTASHLPQRPATAPTPAPLVMEAEDPRLQLHQQMTMATSETPARSGWRGWCNKMLGTSLGASSAERATRARRVRIQRPLGAHRTVAVLQLKGGGGKTTTAYHLAATYGRVRGGNILAGEFNENQGTLAERSLTADHDRTTLDLIRNLETVTRRTADLVRYVRPQGDDRIHVLASPPEGTDRSRVDGRSVRTAHETLRSLYSLILLDTGNSAQSSTWRAAVDVADSLVLVAHNREDDARLLEATVEAVRAEGHGDKLTRSVLVVSNTATNNTERISRLRDYAEAIGLAGCVVIPFDKSLQEGRAFHYDALHPTTVRAYEEATATLTDQL